MFTVLYVIVSISEQKIACMTLSLACKHRNIERVYDVRVQVDLLPERCAAARDATGVAAEARLRARRRRRSSGRQRRARRGRPQAFGRREQPQSGGGRDASAVAPRAGGGGGRGRRGGRTPGARAEQRAAGACV